MDVVVTVPKSLTTAKTYCAVCQRDTVHDVGVVDGIWCILGCQECQGKQASDRLEETPKKPRNHEEDDLDRAILELAHLYGYLAHHTRPAWTAKGYRTSLMGDKGFPDWCLTRAGSPGRSKRVLFIETKSTKGKVSPEQKLWYDTLNNTGAEVYVVKPADLDWLIERLK